MFAKSCKLTSTLAASWSIHSLMRLYPGQNQLNITPAMSNYVGLLAKSLGRSYNYDLMTFDLWWMRNPATGASITEVGIGVHYNGLLSTIIAPSYFASQAITQQLRDNEIDFRLYEGAQPQLFSSNESRQLITVMHAQNDFASLDKTMAVVSGEAPCSPNVIKLIEKLKKHVASLPVAEIQTELDQVCDHIGKLADLKTVTDAYREKSGILHKALDEKLNWPHFMSHWPEVFNYPSMPNDAFPICNVLPVSMAIYTYNRRYCAELHDHFPNGRTAVTRALLNDDKEAFLASLAEDPYLAIKADAFNETPLSFSIDTGNVFYLSHLYETSQRLSASCPWLLRHLSLARHFLNHPHLLEANAATAKKLIATLVGSEKNLNSQRAAIHHACAEDDLEQVKQILNETPEAVNAVDPWGMTPIIIALGKNNLDLIRLLLERGSHKHVLSQEDYINAKIRGHFCGWGLLESAKSPEAIQLLLMNRVKPNQSTQLVWEAIWFANLDLLKWFYRFRRDEIQNESGLKPIELAIYKASEYLNNPAGEPQPIKVLDWMLRQITFPLCSKNLNASLHPLITEKLQQHNQRLQDYAELLRMRPKCIRQNPVVLDEDARCLYTYMKKNETEFTLVIKPTADLTEEEFAQIYFIYEEFFQKNNLTPLSKEAFFEDNFPKKRSKDIYIELCYVDGKVVSFISFTFIESEHPKTGPFLLYYGKLGATKGYNRNGLIEANFRLPQALYLLNEDKMPIWSFYKSIRPGGSWLLIDSVDFEAFPKFNYDLDLMHHIVRLSHEEMHEYGKIRANLIVQITMSDLPLIQEYNDLAGPDPRDALAVIYPITKDTVKHALGKQLQSLGIDYEILRATAAAFQKLREINQALINSEMPSAKM